MREAFAQTQTHTEMVCRLNDETKERDESDEDERKKARKLRLEHCVIGCFCRLGRRFTQHALTYSAIPSCYTCPSRCTRLSPSGRYCFAIKLFRSNLSFHSSILSFFQAAKQHPWIILLVFHFHCLSCPTLIRFLRHHRVQCLCCVHDTLHASARLVDEHEEQLTPVHHIHTQSRRSVRPIQAKYCPEWVYQNCEIKENKCWE